jgi:RHS repeat-associated protein
LGDITFQLSNYTQSWDVDSYTPFANRLFGWNGSSTPYLYSVKPISPPSSGNRQPSAAHMMEGTLNRIDYPTGGNTQFVYEPHTYKGKIEEFKMFYPLQQQACTWCTIPNSNSSYNNCTGPSGIGASCIRDIKIKNVKLASGTPTSKLLFALSLDNLGNVSYGMTFSYSVKKNGVQIKTGNFSLPANQKKNVIVDNFLATFWNASTILPTDNIDIDILRTSVNGTPDTLCNLKFQVFYPTFGVVDGDKIAGGCRVKQVISSDGVDNTKNMTKAYEYKDDAGVFSSGVLVSKIQVVNDLAVRDQDKVWSFNEVDYVYRNSPNNNEINAPLTPVFGLRLWTVLGSPLSPPSNNQSGLVGYKNVKVSQLNALSIANDGYSKYSYFVDIPYTESNRLTLYPDVPEFSTSGKTGNLSKEEHFSVSNTLVRQVIYDYTELSSFPNFTMGTVSVTGYLFPKPNKGRLKKYFIRAGYNTYLTKKTEVNDGVTTVTDFTYNATWQHHNAVETIVTNSDNIPYKTKTYYAHEMAKTDLISRNMIGMPLKTEQYVNDVLKSGSQTIYSLVATTLGTFPRPTQFQSLRRDGTTWDIKMTVNAYESTTGLPTSTTRQGFTVPETYAWSNKLLTSKTFGGLTWNYEYKPNTSMIAQIIDENRLRTKFYYDNLQRLQKVESRMKDDGTDVQATTLYDYHYKGQPATNPIDVNSNFVSTVTTFANATNTTPLSTKQYMDGLGRSIETVKELYTPYASTHPANYWHQKNYMTYDALGRPNQSYLPFESSSLGYEVAGAVPFSFATYEQSPLSRPLRQTNVDGTSVTMSYGTNATTDNIRKFVFTPVLNAVGTVINNNIYHPANLFYKTTKWDENGTALLATNPATTIGKTELYQDKLGRTHLSRRFLNGQAVDTYNIYDDYGNLTMVIPPGALDANGNPIASLIFTYRFDVRNRMIEKKVPNADPVKFFYDDRDLPVLYQDGNMKLAKNPSTNVLEPKHLATIYDNIGRARLTGFILNFTPILGTDGSLTTNLDVLITDIVTETQFYPNRSWVKNQGAKVLKPTGVTTERDFMWSYIERRVGYEYTGNPIWMGKQHLLSKTYVNGTSLVTADAPITDNDYGGVNWTVSSYDGAQKPTLTINYLYSGPSSTHAQEVRQWQAFEYDNAQRLKQTKYTYELFGTALTAPDKILSNFNYNARNQVIEKNTALVLGKYLQSTNYAYNDRGLLTSINSGFLPSSLDYPIFNDATVSSTVLNNYASLGTSGLLTPLPQSLSGETNRNPDLFKEIIRYDAPIAAYPGSQPAQRNGNISQLEWQVAGREAQGYSFKYDDLDRLLEANYTDIHAPNQGWASTYDADSKYRETATYDIRGNIQSINRSGRISTTLRVVGSTTLVCGTFGAIDNLAYSYDSNDKNKLLKVAESSNTSFGFRTISATVNASSPHYAYDANGNLITDANKEITNISYNHLNLPLVITFAPLSGQPRRIEFIYDAMGVKLRKTAFLNNIAIETRDYVNGIEYVGGVLNRFAHTEGAVVRNENNEFEHQYVIRDHLGNTRVTYRDGIKKAAGILNPTYNDGTITSTDVMQVNHYYPFGMNMDGNWNSTAATNKYQYNDKEFNTEFLLNWNDYGARFYDASIGRWNGVDLLAEIYSAHSPYQYVMNNPVNFIDPNGMGHAEYNPQGGDKFDAEKDFNIKLQYGYFICI